MEGLNKKEDSIFEKNIHKYPFLDENKNKILKNKDKYTRGDENKYISIGLYFNGGKLKEEDRDFLEKLEENLKQKKFKKKEDIRKKIQKEIYKGALYIDGDEFENWSETINTFIKEGGKIEEIFYFDGEPLSWELVKFMDIKILKNQAQNIVYTFENQNFKYEDLAENQSFIIDNFIKQDGDISKLKTKNGEQLDAGKLLYIMKEYYTKRAEYFLREIEKDPSKYNSYIFEKFEEDYGDLSYIKTKEDKHLNWKYLNSLEKINITRHLQKSIENLENDIGKWQKEDVQDYWDIFKSLRCDLSKLKRADGGPVTEAYLNYILKS